MTLPADPRTTGESDDRGRAPRHRLLRPGVIVATLLLALAAATLAGAWGPATNRVTAGLSFGNLEIEPGASGDFAFACGNGDPNTWLPVQPLPEPTHQVEFTNPGSVPAAVFLQWQARPAEPGGEVPDYGGVCGMFDVTIEGIAQPFVGTLCDLLAPGFEVPVAEELNPGGSVVAAITVTPNPAHADWACPATLNLTAATTWEQRPTVSGGWSDHQEVGFTILMSQTEIVVVGETVPAGDPQLFTFDPSWSEADFSLSGGSPHRSGALPAGTYNVTETVPAGWDLTSATCSDGSPVTAIDLSVGETVTCTFTNTERGHILVDKVAEPAADSPDFDFTANWGGPDTPPVEFSLADGDAAADSGALRPGTL